MCGLPTVILLLLLQTLPFRKQRPSEGKRFCTLTRSHNYGAPIPHIPLDACNLFVIELVAKTFTQSLAPPWKGCQGELPESYCLK